MPLPWSVQFLLKYSPRMSLASVFRYRRYVLRDGGVAPRRNGTIELDLKRPIRGRISLREPGSDIHTFREVMIAEIYSEVARLAPNCQYVLDLGANVGLTSLYLSQRFPQCRIVSVEPDPHNQQLLRNNLASLIASGRCEIVEAAAWGEDTTLALSAPPNDVDYDAISVSTANRDDHSRDVPALRVDTLMERAKLPRIDILKIDIEGAETDLFLRDPSWLEQVNAISIEFHGETRTKSRFDKVANSYGLMVVDDKSPNTVLAYRDAKNWIYD